MVVYILHYRWENEDNGGAKVLGVYAEDNLAEAQAEMRDLAARRKKLEENAFWQDDYTCEEPMAIFLGHCGMGMYEVPEIYRWEIECLPVKEVRSA